MKFRYTGRTKSGELQTGFIEAINRESATNTLVSHDLLVLGVDPMVEKKWYDPVLNIFKRVKSVDLMIFTRQFATLLSAKISLSEALKNLYNQTKNPILRDAIFEIASDVDSGLSLSQALERHATIFPTFYVNMVLSAEITGRLDEVMGFVADYMEKSNATITKVRNAMIYPVVVVGLLIIVGGIMIGFVFPQLIPIFTEANVQLPLPTRIIFGVGTFVSNWWLEVLIALAVAGFFLTDYLRGKEGRAILDQLVLKLPIFGNLFKKMYISRFSELTSVLIKGGTPIAQSLEIAGQTIGSLVYRDAILEVAEAVREGQLMSQSLEEHGAQFPALVSQMVSVGESTGRLEELLNRIAVFYTREVDDVVNNLVELIQPLLMVVIGVAVGLLFAAVLMPIYNLVQTF